MTTADTYRQAFGEAAPVSMIPEPTPTVERIPRTIDGGTWYAYSEHDGERIGATARTKRDVLTRFSEQWGRFAQ